MVKVERHRWRDHVAARATIAQIDPEVRGMAASLPAKQGDRGLVAVHFRGFEDVGQQALTDRSE